MVTWRRLPTLASRKGSVLWTQLLSASHPFSSNKNTTEGLNKCSFLSSFGNSIPRLRIFAQRAKFFLSCILLFYCITNQKKPSLSPLSNSKILVSRICFHCSWNTNICSSCSIFFYFNFLINPMYKNIIISIYNQYKYINQIFYRLFLFFGSKSLQFGVYSMAHISLEWPHIINGYFKCFLSTDNLRNWSCVTLLNPI